MRAMKNRPSMQLSVLALASAIFTFSPTFNISAAGLMDPFIDKEDGWVDGSDWVLNNATGFLPLPIIITEPAVDNGLGVAALFFHPPEDYDPDAAGPGFDQDDAEAGDEDFVLPNVTAVAGAITGNNSWLVGGGHFAYWKDDTIRFEASGGYAVINLNFYGLAEGPEIDQGIKFEAKGTMVDLPISFRLRDSNFFLGAGYQFTSADTSTDFSGLLPPEWQDPEFSRLNLDTTLSKLAVFAQYDSRDNVFTPSSGFNGKVTLGRNDNAIGSDWDYTEFKIIGHQYWSLGKKFVLGLRGDYNGVNGEVPFFTVPFIELRGIPALRYQGKSVLVGETELRWAFHRRISAVGFLGAGRAAESFSNLDDASTRVTQGLGIRYLAARKLGMQGGIDVAFGPEDTYWYVTFGSAW
jgi:hypothetical protein